MKLLKTFLDLDKCYGFGSSVEVVAITLICSWMRNGYNGCIANKLYAQTAQCMTDDGILSYLAQCVPRAPA